jgi:hypothetical protein
MVGGPLEAGSATTFWTMGEVWLEYLRMLVYPPALSLSHDVVPRHGVGLASLAGWGALAGSGAFATWRWRSGSSSALGIWLWGVVPLLPVSQLLLPLQNVIADRYLWLSVMAMGLVAGAWPRPLPLGRGLGPLLVAAFALATGARATLFGDGALLFADAAAKSRGPLAPLQLAVTLEQRGELDAADRAYRDAVQRPCRECEMARRASNNLARLLVARGELQAADELLRAALERFPDDPTLHYNRVKVLQRLDRTGEARRLYERSVERFPGYFER